MYTDRSRRLSFSVVRRAHQTCADPGPISEHHRKTGNALRSRSVGLTCLLALASLCLAAFAKTALAQDFTGAVYVGTNAQQNGLVAYGRRADGTLAYIGEYLSGGAGGRLNTGGPIDAPVRVLGIAVLGSK